MYDAMGNRVYKSAVPNSGTLPGDVTYYVRDATGNVMAIYQADPSAPSTFAKVQYPLYGSSRIGVANYTLPYTLPTTSFNRTLNYKAYELNDHLGNVMVNVADWRKGYDNNADGIADVYRADHSNGADYYPFGMIMPGRNNASSNQYRYGFNGKEMDNQTDQVTGSNLDFGARIYDSRLARWYAPDGKQGNYASWSPYHFGFCSPIITIDPDGAENIIVVGSDYGARAGGQSDKAAATLYRSNFTQKAAGIYNQYAHANPGEKTTLLLYTSYNDEEDKRLINLAISNGVPASDITIVCSKDDIINYMNNRQRDITIPSNGVTAPISGGMTPIKGIDDISYYDKVTDFTYVGHATSTSLYLSSPYVPGGEDFNMNDFGPNKGEINYSDFTPNAKINLISCRGGSGGEFDLMKNLDKGFEEHPQGGHVQITGAASGKEIWFAGGQNAVWQGGGSSIQQGIETPSNSNSVLIPVSQDKSITPGDN